MEPFRFLPYKDVSRLPHDEIARDVSSRAVLPFCKLSPFYPHGGIPIPGTDGGLADSVEGIWQGLKVIDSRMDESYFKGKGRKRRGRPSGHRFGDELLGYIEARKRIYVPSYEYLWRCCIGRDLREALFRPALRGDVQWFYDREANGDIEDASRPFAHAALLVRLLVEEFPFWVERNESRCVET